MKIYIIHLVSSKGLFKNYVHEFSRFQTPPLPLVTHFSYTFNMGCHKLQTPPLPLILDVIFERTLMVALNNKNRS